MPRHDKPPTVLTDFCVQVHWGADAAGPVLPWRPAPPLEADPAGAEELVRFYEQANERAHSNDMERALSTFREGLDTYRKLHNPTPTQTLLARALLWGQAACLARAGREEEAWPMLERVIDGCSETSPLTVDLVLNWAQSSLVTAQALQLWGESAALLNFLHELCWKAQVGAGTQVHEFVLDRWKRLEPLRLATFNGLMQKGQHGAAAALCEYVVAAAEDGRYDTPEQALTLWGDLLTAARAGSPDFHLETHLAERAGAGEPAVALQWMVENGAARLRWHLVEREATSADESRLWTRFAEASRAADGGNLVGALSAHNAGLQEFERLPQPGPADRLVRWMLLWGKGVTLDTLAAKDPRLAKREDAWQALCAVAQGEAEIGRPIPLVLTWVRSSLVVGVGTEHFPECIQLLNLLFGLAVHPEIRNLPELRSEIMTRFMTFIQNCHDALKSGSPPERVREFALLAQKGLEPPGVVFLPVREILWDAHELCGDATQAQQVVREVAAWARDNGAPDIAAEWEKRARH
jgi:hypothetical protein